MDLVGDARSNDVGNEIEPPAVAHEGRDAFGHPHVGIAVAIGVRDLLVTPYGGT